MTTSPQPSQRPATASQARGNRPGQPTDRLFAATGLRCTKQRKALYEALAASRSHPTADELFRQVNPRVDGLSLATVYNTLEAFCQAGLVQKLPGAGTNGSARYDAVRGDHLHVRCQSSGAVADVPRDLSQQVLQRIPPDLLQELESRLGFRIDQVQIELVGQFQNEK